MKKREFDSTATPQKAAGRGGRPSREEALRREKLMLEVAAVLFMERGFEETSIDAIAERAGISKPTLYSRYQDKKELFAAVLKGRIERWLVPLSATAEAIETERDIEVILHDLSRRMLAVMLAPEAVALRRILVAQSLRFPDLAKLAHEEGWLRSVRAIAKLLHKFSARGELVIANPELSAEQFLCLTLGGAGRSLDAGLAVEPDSLELRRQAAVELFLNGVRA